MKAWIKDILDMLAALFTIIVSLMAVGGTLVAYEHDFFKKLNHVVNYYHQEIKNIEEKDL